MRIDIYAGGNEIAHGRNAGKDYENISGVDVNRIPGCEVVARKGNEMSLYLQNAECKTKYYAGDRSKQRYERTLEREYPFYH